MRKLLYLLIAAALCVPVGAQAWWKSIQQVAVSGAPPATTTWNPADKGPDITLSGGNLTFTQTSATSESARATKSASSGKKYFEYTDVVNGSFTSCGIANATFNLNGTFLGSDTNGVNYIPSGGVFLNNASIATIQTSAQGDTIGVAVDLGAMLIWFRTNGGNWNNSGTANPATGVGGISISGIAAGPYFPTAFGANVADSLTANFGATAYSQTVPSGFGNW